MRAAAEQLAARGHEVHVLALARTRLDRSATIEELLALLDRSQIAFERDAAICRFHLGGVTVAAADGVFALHALMTRACREQAPDAIVVSSEDLRQILPVTRRRARRPSARSTTQVTDDHVAVRSARVFTEPLRQGAHRAKRRCDRRQSISRGVHHGAQRARGRRGRLSALPRDVECCARARRKASIAAWSRSSTRPRSKASPSS